MSNSLIDIDKGSTHTRINLCGLKFSVKHNFKKLQNESAKNYASTLLRIKKKYKSNTPIKVLFYVMEKQKWGYQSLYDELKKDPHFEPLIVVSCVTDDELEVKAERCSIEENIEFFKDRGIDVVSAFEKNKHIDLLKFEPDIIFYQQPWYIPEVNHPIRMSNYALCCYCSYSIAATKTASMRRPLFFYNIWKYFLAHDCMKDEYAGWMECNHESLVVTGHPKLDVYKNYKFDGGENSKHYVIYAPHFSLGQSILSFSTFDWSGQFMLDYAKKHPEINWVFKPHPRFRSFFLENNIMTEEELDKYFNEWAKIGLLYDDGDYFDIFKNSDAMITDCGSFCVEYFFTGKPLLHMISAKSKPHSALNRLVNCNHYSIFNKETLSKYLDEILIKQNDFLKDVRIKALAEIFAGNCDSAQNIIKYIKEELEK